MQPRVEIHLEFDASSTRDGAEVLAAYLVDLSEEEMAETAGLTLTMDLKGTGKLIWDLAEGRAVQLDLQAELAFEAEVTWDQSIFAEDPTAFYARYELSGETTYQVTFE